MKSADTREDVLVSAFAPILREAIEKQQEQWRRENDCAGKGRDWFSTSIGPLARLSQLSGVPERRINGYCAEDTYSVDLLIADKLFDALDIPLSILPESAFVSKTQARRDAQEQMPLLEEFARSQGLEVPPHGSKERRSFGCRMRRQWAAYNRRTVTA